VHLSPDQETALDRCLASIEVNQETVLVGPAGSGKTTLLREIIARSRRRTVLGCPTGKAAQRLSEVTGRSASTIHKLIYREVEDTGSELLFTQPAAPCREGELLIIDEASMLGKKLYNELMTWLPDGARVLFVGDSEQLEPVKDSWGPDLKNPTARLTEVHRQALDNPIIAYATAIRQDKGDAWLAQEWDHADGRVNIEKGAHPAMRWYMDRLREGKDATLLTFTHRVRRAYNEYVRKNLGVEGEPLAPGDKILVKTNRHSVGLMNGQVLTVESMERIKKYKYDPVYRLTVKEREGTVWVNTDMIEKEPRDFWGWYRSLPKWACDQRLVHIWYGNCLTVHSSQGSQWDEVGFLWDKSFNGMRRKDKPGARRFLYTAVTRASENLSIFVV
jgi:exodeoxyribonuclease-5